MADVKITGELHLWTQNDWGHGTHSYTGYVFNDSKGRFEDGELIHTSQVVKREGALVYTLNSVYRLWYPDETIQLVKEAVAAKRAAEAQVG